MDTATVLLTVLTVGIGVIIGAMSWMMKTLMEVRIEISGANARQDEQLEDHERRITRLETL